MIKNIKASVRQKGKFWHTVVTYTEDGVRQESWKSTGLPIANNKRRAQALAEERAAAFSEEAEERNRMESWGADSSIRDMLFADLIQQWYQHKALYISQSTQEGYLRILRYADPYFRKKGLTVQQVTQAHIQKYLSSLQEGRAKPLSNNTIKKHLVLLKSVFNEAMKDGTVTFNPARRVAQPKPVPYQAQTYSAEELHSLFHMLEGNDIHGIVLITAFYGLRRSEACGLRWQDVDFEQNILFIRHKVLQTHLNGTFQVTQTNELKTEASRRAFTLTPTIRELLLNRRMRADNNRKQWGNCYNHDFDEYVFTLENGDLLTPDKVSNRFRAFIKRKGLKKIRYHDLRHPYVKHKTKSFLRNFRFFQGQSLLPITFPPHKSLSLSKQYQPDFRGKYPHVQSVRQQGRYSIRRRLKFPVPVPVWRSLFWRPSSPGRFQR